jgi:hypothetical protein
MWIFTIALTFIPVCCWTNRRFVVARQSCYTKELTILFKKTLLCRQHMFFSPCRYSHAEKFEDTKGVIRQRKSKDRQHMTKGTRTYNGQQSNCWHRPYTKIIHVHVVFGSIRYLSSIEYMKALILVFIVDWLLNIWRASLEFYWSTQTKHKHNLDLHHVVFLSLCSVLEVRLNQFFLPTNLSIFVLQILFQHVSRSHGSCV